MVITSKRCSWGSSLSCDFIKWDWVKCFVHFLKCPWAVPPGYHMLKEKLYFVCWHSIKILFRTDKGRLLACLCVLIRRFHSRLKFLIEHQNFIHIERYKGSSPYVNFISANFITAILQNIPELFGLCVFWVIYFITAIFCPKIAQK